MESQNPSRTLAVKALLLLAFLVFQAPESSTLSQALHSEPTLFQSPAPSPPSRTPKFPQNPRLRRILLGALFGSLTGFVASIIILLLVRLLLMYACRAPILKGPVVFCPSISPKTLQSLLSTDAQSMQLIVSSPNGKYYRVVLDEDELTMAVKRLEPSPSSGSPPVNSNSQKRRVQHELEMLARVKHRNVMSLRAYIRDQDRFWLVTATHYVAPECFQSCRYTDKSDVYSFGVILGVLFTGKDPSYPFFAGETGRGSLGRWLRHLQQAGEAREALDKGILGEEMEEEEMLMAIRIAIVCLSDLPADRPSSDELVAMLTQLHSF
ncbi:hypothetical protein OPV22_005796 [Ensete ventricosum]|uniref:Protein kinase domain-containing protein n=1 Tax=Ensete ventricosum TaxID=4639 RepID=A0AAV8RDN4_ENSVE|nr:hypothetical protein OPV22_005796 [Ensete ventricosum]